MWIGVNLCKCNKPTDCLDSSIYLVIGVFACHQMCLIVLWRTSLYGFRLWWRSKPLSQQKRFQPICWEKPRGCISAPAAFNCQRTNRLLLWIPVIANIFFKVCFSLLSRPVGPTDLQNLSDNHEELIKTHMMKLLLFMLNFIGLIIPGISCSMQRPDLSKLSFINSFTVWWLNYCSPLSNNEMHQFLS